MTRRRNLLTFALLMAIPALAGAVDWNIDPVHSVASFKVRHLMISNVTGQIGKVTGVVKYDPADVAKSSVEASIDTTALNTNVADRDKHLKSPDFFDVEKYPTITFKSKKVEPSGDGKLKVTGDLTIKGVTKEVTLDVDGPSKPVTAMGGQRSGVTVTGKVNRQDFGVSWNKTLDGGGVVVSDDVTIDIEVEMVHKEAQSK